jgi:hypothetical protein
MLNGIGSGIYVWISPPSGCSTNAVSQAEIRRGMDKIEKAKRKNNNSLVIRPA